MKEKVKYLRTTSCVLCNRAIEKRNESPIEDLCAFCYKDPESLAEYMLENKS